MSLFFNENSNVILNETANVQDVLIADELSRVLSEQELMEFLESSECESLVEAGVLRRRTVVRLSKKDDLLRRSRLASLQIAKNKKDPMVKLLSKAIKQKHTIMDKIYNKYKSIAEREARKAQKEYYKRVPALRLRIPGNDTTGFKKA